MWIAETRSRPHRRPERACRIQHPDRSQLHVPPEQTEALAREEPPPNECNHARSEDAGLQDAAKWLARLSPDRFGTLTADVAAVLTELDLRGLEITDADLRMLSGFPNLERLSLRGTAITDQGLAHLSHLSLALLDLRATEVTGMGLRYLPRGLEALHLTDTKVLGTDLVGLPPMPKLNLIKLIDSALDWLARYPALRHVELDQTQITDDALRQLLYANPHLTRVEIRNTQISAAVIEELARLYPGCAFVQETSYRLRRAGF